MTPETETSRISRSGIRTAAALAAVVLAASVCGQERRNVLDLRLRAQYADSLALLPATSQAERTFQIDSAGRVDISIVSNSTTLELSLVDPAGTAHAFGVSDSVVSASYKLPDPAGKGQNYEFELLNPASGTWKYRVKEPATFTGARAVLFSMTSDSDLVACLLGTGGNSTTARAVTLAVAVADRSGGVTGSEISSLEGYVRHVALTSPQSLTFRDDGQGDDDVAGDGVHTATFQAPAPGDYNVLVVVTGVRNGVSFARTVGGRLSVISDPGALLRTFTSRAVDTTGDNKFDFLDLTFDVKVVRTGRFLLSVTLTASNGKSTHLNETVDLVEGVRTATLRVAASELRALECDGPYLVSEVGLGYYSGDQIVSADRQFDLGSTSAFSLAAAVRSPILLTGLNSETARDTNNNKTFDVLEFQTGLDLESGGLYQWSASLYDQKGTRIDFASAGDNVQAGQVKVPLKFSGSKIGANGVDGPYYVRNFLITSAKASAVLLRAGQTQYYPYELFEGAKARPAGPAVSAGGIVNAASYLPALAPGMIATMFGLSLAASTVFASEVPLPTELSGTRVIVNGVDAPLFYVSPNQINFQVPFEAPVQTYVPVVLMRDGSPKAGANVTISENAPGIFWYAREAGVQDAIALHLDGRLVSPTAPAQPDEILIVYGTGIGALLNPPLTSTPALAAPLAVSSLPPAATVGAVPATVLFAGLAPNFVGLVQVNLRMPATLPAGVSLQPLVITIGGVSSPAVSLAVKPSEP
jgi:uncharacterized protein (TIGR03437 family)